MLENQAKKVVCLGKRLYYAEYRYKDYEVVIFLDSDKKPSCTCKHGYYSVKKQDEICTHIRIVRIRVKQEGTWEW